MHSELPYNCPVLSRCCTHRNSRFVWEKSLRLCGWRCWGRAWLGWPEIAGRSWFIGWMCGERGLRCRGRWRSPGQSASRPRWSMMVMHRWSWARILREGRFGCRCWPAFLANRAEFGRSAQSYCWTCAADSHSALRRHSRRSDIRCCWPQQHSHCWLCNFLDYNCSWSYSKPRNFGCTRRPSHHPHCYRSRIRWSPQCRLRIYPHKLFGYLE